MSVSETSKIRSRVLPYLKEGMNGLDVGYGGDPITHGAIAMDQRHQYGRVGGHPQHLYGDARDLRWFRDGVLDYVYSSHVLEDFADTRAVLAEWLRVLKPGGLLILYLPDERRFRDVCRRTGQSYNPHHKQPAMSLPFVEALLAELGAAVIDRQDETGPNQYSFLVVARKE